MSIAVLWKKMERPQQPTLISWLCLPHIPETVQIGYLKVKVSVHVPTPVRCYTCQKFGHTSSKCTATDQTCVRCGKHRHEGACDLKCTNWRRTCSKLPRSALFGNWSLLYSVLVLNRKCHLVKPRKLSRHLALLVQSTLTASLLLKLYHQDCLPLCRMRFRNWQLQWNNSTSELQT